MTGLSDPVEHKPVYPSQSPLPPERASTLPASCWIGVRLDRVDDLVHWIVVLDEAHVVGAGLLLASHLPVQQKQGAVGDLATQVDVRGHT